MGESGSKRTAETEAGAETPVDMASQERETQVTRLARRGFIAFQRPNAVALLLSLLCKLGGSGSPGQLLQQ